MQILPQAKKKQIISIGVIVLCLLGIIYFSFFAGPRSGNKPSTFSDAASPFGQAGAEQSRLPFGSTINAEILSSLKFKALKGYAALKILPEELGKLDLFKK